MSNKKDVLDEILVAKTYLSEHKPDPDNELGNHLQALLSRMNLTSKPFPPQYAEEVQFDDLKHNKPTTASILIGVAVALTRFEELSTLEISGRSLLTITDNVEREHRDLNYPSLLVVHGYLGGLNEIINHLK